MEEYKENVKKESVSKNSHEWFAWEKHILSSIEELKDKCKTQEKELANCAINTNNQQNQFKDEIRKEIYNIIRDMDSLKMKIAFISTLMSAIGSGIIMIVFKIISGLIQ